MAPAFISFSRSRSQSRGPPSPTFSDITHVSAMNFGNDGPHTILTRSDLADSIHSYENLIMATSTYRTALMNMSKATAALADAMSTCSGLKGITYEAGTRLQASSGLHHLIGNHWHILSETLDKKFERPLRSHLDAYRAVVTERSNTYERALREKSQIIRDTEKRNINRKGRNLQSFRETLAALQRQVDDLDDLKIAHYNDVLEHQEEVWNVVQNKICLAMRSTMEVFEKFTAKMSDPVIEPMLQSIPDPFDSYGPPQSEDQIFSILAPLPTISQILPTTSTPSSVNEVHEDMPARSNTWAGDTLYPSQASSSNDPESPTTPTTPRSFSPPSLLSHRHSSPAIHANNNGAAKAETGTIRSPSNILSMISEDTSQDTTSLHLNTSVQRGGTIKAPKPERATSSSITDLVWKPPYAANPSYENFHQFEDTSSSQIDHTSFYQRSASAQSNTSIGSGLARESDETIMPIAVTG